jgi:hypothetical protein
MFLVRYSHLDLRRLGGIRLESGKYLPNTFPKSDPHAIFLRVAFHDDGIAVFNEGTLCRVAQV